MQLKKDYVNRFYMNAAANLFTGAPDIFCDEQQEKYNGHKFVILGAGPTLDDKGEMIRQHQKDGFKIIATDRAVIPCRHHKVEPDIVVSIDPTACTTDFFGYEPPEGDIWASLCANPNLVQQGENLHFFMPQDVYKRNANQLNTIKYSVLPAFGHCSGTAVALALLMSATDVIVYGCDYVFHGVSGHCPHRNDDYVLSTQYYAKPINAAENNILAWHSEAITYNGMSSYPYAVDAYKGIYTTDNLQSCKQQLKAVSGMVQKHMAMQK